MIAISQSDTPNSFHLRPETILSMDSWLDLTDLIERVQECLEIGLYEDAKDLLDQYVDVYRGEWEIFFLYSRVYAEDNDPQKAIDFLYKALRLDKNNLDCLLGLFYAFIQIDQIRKAGRFLNKAERLYPGNELVLNALIWYYTELSDFEKAIACFENNADLLDKNPEALRNAGIAYERFGNQDRAQECFAQALHLQPHFDEVRDLLADHFIIRGETSKSIELYRQHLQLSPNNIKSLSRLVFSLSQDNQVEEAEQVARKTIRLFPNSPVGYVDLSYVYLNSNRPELALEAADKALDISPVDAEAYRVKAISYSELKNNTQASECFDHALSLEPDNPEIMRDFYHHLRQAGHHDQMIEMIQKVIKQERPYCMEDYWFLADHYQEINQPLKAFGYLHLAYKSMPGENELIPPMVDIMLNRGHVSYTLPFLRHYVEQKGWNDVMISFTRHKRLKGKWNQENLRFLRFYGQEATEFRSFAFSHYFRKFLLIASILLLFLLFGVVLFVFDLPIAVAVCIGVVVCFLAVRRLSSFVRRMFRPENKQHAY